MVYCLTNKVTSEFEFGDITPAYAPVDHFNQPAHNEEPKVQCDNSDDSPPWEISKFRGKKPIGFIPREEYKMEEQTTKRKTYKSRFDHLFEPITDLETQELPFAPVTSLDEWFVIHKRMQKKFRKLASSTTKNPNSTEFSEYDTVYLLNKKDRMKVRARKFYAEEIQKNPEYTKFYLWLYNWLHADWNTNKRRVHAYDTHTTPPYETAKLFTPFPIPEDYMKFFLFHWHMEQVFKEQDKIAPFTGLEPMEIGSM